MTKCIVYGDFSSAYVRTVRLTLLEKHVPFDLAEVDVFGADGPPDTYLAHHPFGRIPAFSHDGFEIFETHAICRYIDEAFDGPSLQPRDVKLRARMAQIVGLLDSYAYRPMVWDVFVERVRRPLQGAVSDEAKITSGLAKAKRVLDVLEDLLSDYAWLAGPALSLADLHFYPMIDYFCAAGEGRALVAAHPKLEAWRRRCADRESIKATVSPPLLQI
ncbi:glutathione S-transferase family protein [Methylovirgula sp. 4M-Z18]|uniref:glutathione S-transferase family protein n=1 Tax=Methylovirgula sp. 4M-Z18 TaxID=2293567 RepID=UPI000E2F6841|nr:glutathione S-transferase family protein [Methylovirgula sp. 4M-Z18]RFB78030.1 glutathione S-transferase family protein [Methylovirgula sp. 4M-Z18]